MYMARQNKKNRSWREVRKCRSFVCRKKRQRARRAIKTFIANAWGGLVWLLEKLARIPWIYIKALCLAVASSAVTLWRWFWPYKVKGEPKFHSLAPTKNAERIDIYKEALSQALLDPSILNIAVAGAYGSGKSSFLRTYFKENPSFWPFGGKKNKVITISLAELAAKSEEPKPEEIDKKHLITRQEVELSILHQLFFHERSGSLADSHFTKIQKFGFWKLWFYTTCLVLYIVSCIHLLKPGLWTTILRLEELSYDITTYRTWWHWIFVGIAIAGTIWVSRYLIRVIAQLTVRKLSVETAKIEIASKLEKSILNAHIDEIIYFFSATGYNVVLLEDLDRFKQQNIFVKLREINHLINNSEEVKQPVRFIYALRDEMFVNDERTKFFDFIIPIIPRVDISNAGDVLHTLMPDYLGNVVDAVAMYLHDTRMLNNIANEFNIYKHQQFKKSKNEEEAPKLDVRGEEQLLTLIIYKNLYPEDFEKLRTNKKGLLAQAIDGRKTLIEQNIQKIDARKNEINTLLKEAENERLKDVRELRKLLVVEVMKDAMQKSENNRYVYNMIHCDGQTFYISDLVSDDIFKLFQKAPSYTYYNSYYNSRPSGAPYAQLTKLAYGEESYESRLKLINIKSDDSAYQEELQRLDENRAHLNNANLQELLRNKETVIDWGEYGNEEYSDQRRFVRDMLFHGYITENYADYISFFHPGYMTNNDYQFIRSVRIQEQLGFNFGLKNTQRIIEKLDGAYFLQPEILNYALMDALLESFSKSTKCKNTISVIEQYTPESIEFIAGYVRTKGKYGTLIKRLCADGKNLWETISKSHLKEYERRDVLCAIVSNAEEDDAVANLESSTDYLSSMSDYFTWDVNGERLQNVAKRLNLHFTKLDERTDASFVTFVYENNLFEISKDMLERVLPKEIVEDERYHTSNYTYLRDVAPKSLIDYLEKHLADYVQNVLLKMPTDTQEKSLHESALLSSDLSIDLKKRLILQGTEKWDSVDQWDEQTKDVQLMLYKYNRVLVTWENVLYLYALDQEIFVEYIQRDEVINQLTEIGKPEFGGDERTKWEEMQNAIVANQSLSNVAERLVDSFDATFEQETLKNTNERLLRLLVDKGMVACGVNEYNLLRDVDSDLALQFFAEHFDSYAEHIHELNFDEDDVDNLFNQESSLPEGQKLHIIANINAGTIGKYSSLSIIEFLLQPTITNIDAVSEGIQPEISAILFNEEVPSMERIRLFNKYPLTNKREIGEWILTLSESYLKNGRLYRIPYSPEAYDMCTILMRIGYLVNRQWSRSRNWIAVTYPTKTIKTAPLY